MEKFSNKYGLTIFILASKEENLLIETVNRIKEVCSPKDVCEIVIVLKSENCKSAFAADRLVADISEFKIVKYVQKSPDIERCFGEIPFICSSSHFVIMASDLETSPETLSELIRISKDNPDGVVCASKWHKDSSVYGYGNLKEFFNRAMNVYISCLYQRKVTDAFCFYQVYPMSVFNSFNIKNPDKLIYMYTFLVLRTGKKYIEIPTVYHKRTEGKTEFSLFRLFYSGGLKFSIYALKIRFTPKRYLIKKY